MSLTYTYGNDKIVAPVRFSSNDPVFLSETVSGSTQVLKQNRQKWELEFGVVSDDPGSLLGLGVSQATTPHIITMPQLNKRGDSRNSASTNTLSATGTAGNTVVSATGGDVPAGTFIRFSNHSKVYVVVSDFSGGSLNIYPALREDVSGTVFCGDYNVDFKCIRDVGTLSGITYVDGVLAEAGTIRLIEVY